MNELVNKATDVIASNDIIAYSAVNIKEEKFLDLMKKTLVRCHLKERTKQKRLQQWENL